MRRFLYPGLALAVAAAACFGESGPADPEAIGTCEGLADAGLVLLQDTIDSIEDLEAEELSELDGAEDTPQRFREFEVRGDALDARAEQLGCSSQVRRALLAERVDQLEASSPQGQAIIESVRIAGDVDG